MRVFVGININEDIKRKIIDLQKEISAIPSKISFTKVENIHITLKFLGKISEEECKNFIEKIEKVLSGREKFYLHLKGFGGFPCISNPRVLWIGMQENNNLLEIQQDIESISDKFGIPSERNFKGHITIARNKNKIDIPALKQLEEKLRDFGWGDIRVDEIDIIESRLKLTGPEYKVLKSITLEDKKHNG